MVSFFDATAGADFGCLGIYDVPVLPERTHSVFIGGQTYEVVSIEHYVENAAVAVNVREPRPRRTPPRWFR